MRHLFYEQGIAERTIKKNGKKEVENVFDPLFIYCFLGILIGARLGHCLFYQPDYFLTSGKHIVEMLLPIHFIADGGWKFTGYEGVLDNIAIATGTTACFIRLGNLMNSEIIGKITDVPWAFIFERVDSFPRHPGQLYEAIAYAVLFFIMWAIYKRSKKTDSPKVGTGWYFGFCLFYIFTFRFLIEYTKDVQEAWEADMLFNMGQLLSIPFIIIGLYCMIRAKKKASIKQ